MKYIELIAYILLGVTLVAIPTLNHVYSYWLGVATISMFLAPAVVHLYYNIKYLFKHCSTYRWKQAIISLTVFFIAAHIIIALYLNTEASGIGLVTQLHAIAEYTIKGYLITLGMLIIIGNLLRT